MSISEGQVHKIQQDPIQRLDTSGTLKDVKDSLWKQEDIKKRHLKFIEEENDKRLKQYLTQEDWVKQHPNDSTKLRSSSFTNEINPPVSSPHNPGDNIPKINLDTHKKDIYSYYTPRNNISSHQTQMRAFRKKKVDQESQIKELLESLQKKDTEIRRLKKENVTLKTKLRTQVSQIQTDAREKLGQQEGTINAMRQELKQLIQPQESNSEGKSLYAEQLERQVISLKERLEKAQSGNLQLQKIISQLCMNGDVSEKSLFGSRVGVARSGLTKTKILECIAILQTE